MKLSEIKLELKKYLLKYTSIKTDNGVIEYEGEDLVAGMEVYSTNENGEKKTVEDGEYTTEDGKVIVVKDSKVAEIIDTKAEVDGEDSIEAAEEEVVETETTVEEKPTEEAVKEDEIKLEDINEEIANLRKEVDELYKLVDSILKKVGETKDEADARLKKLECASIGKPAAEEFEAASNTSIKTGYKKTDKLIEALKSIR